MPEHIVKQGDCIGSIAFKHGLFWETVWNHPINQRLKHARKNPNILLAGDKVFVPDLRIKQETVATEQKHRFKKKGVPVILRLRLLNYGEPRVNEPYILTIDGSLFSGDTDTIGQIEHVIPPDAKSGKLYQRQNRVRGQADPRLKQRIKRVFIGKKVSCLGEFGFNLGIYFKLMR